MSIEPLNIDKLLRLGVCVYGTLEQRVELLRSNIRIYAKNGRYPEILATVYVVKNCGLNYLNELVVDLLIQNELEILRLIAASSIDIHWRNVFRHNILLILCKSVALDSLVQFMDGVVPLKLIVRITNNNNSKQIIDCIDCSTLKDISDYNIWEMLNFGAIESVKKLINEFKQDAWKRININLPFIAFMLKHLPEIQIGSYYTEPIADHTFDQFDLEHVNAIYYHSILILDAQTARTCAIYGGELTNEQVNCLCAVGKVQQSIVEKCLKNA